MSQNHEKQYSADVIVIGAGFAGVTIARELSQRGKSVLVLEARDRIGGRTLTEKNGFDRGELLELGGVWVHWLQPHVWAELTRYGLELEVCEDISRVLWFADNKLHSGSPEEFDALIASTMDIFVQDALSLFPTPDQPLAQMTDALKEADKLSIKDKIDQIICPSNMIKELIDGFWSINFNCPSEYGAYTQAMRWISRAGGNWHFAFESCGQYKIKKGTFALLKSMFDDAIAHTTLHLNAVVNRVSQTDGCANVQLLDGRQYCARYVVVTVPLNVVNCITFSPPLNSLKQEAAANGQASRGVKLFLLVRGVPSEPFCAYASSNYAINYLQTERYPEFNSELSSDTSILLAFGPDANRINAFDREAVTKELRRWLPDVEILNVMHHNWSKDPFSGETWPMLKPGQLTTYLNALQESEERVRFAGSDYANFYAGSIDGAIESGMRAARLIINELDTLS